MKIRFEVTMDDMLAFNRYHVMNSSTYRRSMIIGMVLISLIPLSLTTFFLLSRKFPTVWVLVVGLLVTAVYVWRYYVRFPKVIDRMTRRLMKEGENRGLFGTHEVEIEDEWLVERTDINASRQAWKAIDKIVENDDYVFIYLSAMTAHVIPKRAVTAGDLAAFVARARQLHVQARVASGS